jgi:putative transposase
MTTTSADAVTRTALTELPERQRKRAFERYQTLRPHLEQNVPLARVAMEAALPLRTAQDWVSRYRRFGLAGLTRAGRADNGKRLRLSEELRCVVARITDQKLGCRFGRDRMHAPF